MAQGRVRPTARAPAACGDRQLEFVRGAGGRGAVPLAPADYQCAVQDGVVSAEYVAVPLRFAKSTDVSS